MTTAAISATAQSVEKAKRKLGFFALKSVTIHHDTSNVCPLNETLKGFALAEVINNPSFELLDTLSNTWDFI